MHACVIILTISFKLSLALIHWDTSVDEVGASSQRKSCVIKSRYKKNALKYSHVCV